MGLCIIPATGDNVPTIVYTYTNTLFLLIKRFNFFFIFFILSLYYCFSKKRLYHVICHVLVSSLSPSWRLCDWLKVGNCGAFSAFNGLSAHSGVSWAHHLRRRRNLSRFYRFFCPSLFSAPKRHLLPDDRFDLLCFCGIELDGGGKSIHHVEVYEALFADTPSEGRHFLAVTCDNLSLLVTRLSD